ncbi:hypothetical protein ElyMa_004698500 [Elysia marginata]|uniref:Uncharacterized protein n=1 Tax=Elysia marginata TaxID=1093978 RepID=A0AAV4I6R2_9GAST|nr:hypothetical protein ElyMa_004698500 [Elysia marginata]
MPLHDNYSTQISTCSSTKLILQQTYKKTVPYNKALAFFKRRQLKQRIENRQNTTGSLNMDKESGRRWRLTQAISEDKPEKGNNTSIIGEGSEWSRVEKEQQMS